MNILNLLSLVFSILFSFAVLSDCLPKQSILVIS